MLSTSSVRPPPRSACAATTIYVGTQQSAPGGIHASRLDTNTGTLTPPTLTASIERPTWLLADPLRPVLYAVSEIGNDGKTQASVTSFAFDAAGGSLRPLGTVSSGGGGATHLALARDGRTLFVANYGTGHVAALPVAADGRLSPAAAVVRDDGSGPSPRQKGPHAHAVIPDPTGRYLLVADLGADRVFSYRLDLSTSALTLAATQTLSSGTGPRHLAFAPNGRFAYLSNELAGTVQAFRWDGATGRLSPVQTLDNTAADYQGPRSASEIGLSRDGRFLYAANRGEDTVVAYAVDRTTGTLRFVQRVAAGGGPWSFAIDPTGRWLIVADQRVGALAVFAIDPRRGTLTPTGSSVSIDKPVSIAFQRPPGCR